MKYYEFRQFDFHIVDSKICTWSLRSCYKTGSHSPSNNQRLAQDISSFEPNICKETTMSQCPLSFFDTKNILSDLYLLRHLT